MNYQYFLSAIHIYFRARNTYFSFFPLFSGNSKQRGLYCWSNKVLSLTILFYMHVKVRLCFTSAIKVLRNLNKKFVEFIWIQQILRSFSLFKVTLSWIKHEWPKSLAKNRPQKNKMNRNLLWSENKKGFRGSVLNDWNVLGAEWEDACTARKAANAKWFINAKVECVRGNTVRYVSWTEALDFIKNS